MSKENNSLTTIPEKAYYFFQLRHCEVPQDEDWGEVFSFLPPIIADESEIGVQVFFRKKDVLNSASKGHFSI